MQPLNQKRSTTNRSGDSTSACSSCSDEIHVYMTTTNTTNTTKLPQFATNPQLATLQNQIGSETAQYDLVVSEIQNLATLRAQTPTAAIAVAAGGETEIAVDGNE